jgi:hypothetical protein
VSATTRSPDESNEVIERRSSAADRSNMMMKQKKHHDGSGIDQHLDDPMKKASRETNSAASPRNETTRLSALATGLRLMITAAPKNEHESRSAPEEER